jgi:hypothetical protein
MLRKKWSFYRTFQNSWIDKFPWVVFDENAQEMYCKYCRKFPHLSDRKDALTRGNKNLRIDGLKLHDKHQEYLVGQKPTRACVVLLSYLRSLFLGVSGLVGSSFAFRFSAFLTKIKIKQRHFSQKLST